MVSAWPRRNGLCEKVRTCSSLAGVRKHWTKAAAEIRKNVTTVLGDVSKLEDIESLYNVVAAQKKTIDIVFANAGFVELKLTPDVTLSHRGRRGQDFDRFLSVR